MKTKLKPPGTKRLKRFRDVLLQLLLLQSTCAATHWSRPRPAAPPAGTDSHGAGGNRLLGEAVQVVETC
jgi:hypothetical protein